jgi:hypothetical protein
MWKRLNGELAEEWSLLQDDILDPEALMLKVGGCGEALLIDTKGTWT